MRFELLLRKLIRRVEKSLDEARHEIHEYFDMREFKQARHRHHAESIPPCWVDEYKSELVASRLLDKRTDVRDCGLKF
jgi:hypothetical protein